MTLFLPIQNLGPVNHNVHLMLRRINDWKNEVSRNIRSDEILGLHYAAVDIVRKATYINHDYNDSDGNFIVWLVDFLEIVH